jgi:hypothetical protein
MSKREDIVDELEDERHEEIFEMLCSPDVAEAIRQRENMTRRERIRMHVHMFFWNMNRTWRDRHYHIANKKLDIHIWYTTRKIERIIKKADKENK